MSFPDITFKNPYFIGIKGAGMVGLATLLHHQGIQVRGSDVEERFFSDEILERLGVTHDGFAAEIPPNCDGVVYSAAYPADHPQRVAAEKRGLPQLTYFEAVGELAQPYETIAVIGTHGKTTTTAILGYILQAISIDPTVLVGSRIRNFNDQTVRTGSSKYFIVEACEYRNHFSHIRPDWILCTNIDYDHVDYYQTPEAYRNEMVRYLDRVPSSKRIVQTQCSVPGLQYGSSDKSSASVRNNNYCSQQAAFQFLSQQGQFQIINLILEQNTYQFKLPLIGQHMASNFTGAVLMAWQIAQKEGIGIEDFILKIQCAIEQFAGITRRMESYGDFQGALLYDDYAHHPEELQATLAGVRQSFPNHQIHVVFQSHTYTRTAQFLDGFAESFDDADHIYIAPTFSSAREQKYTYSDDQLLDLLHARYDGVFFGTFDEIAQNLLSQLLSVNDIVITMGAGDVYKVLDLMKK